MDNMDSRIRKVREKYAPRGVANEQEHQLI